MRGRGLEYGSIQYASLSEIPFWHRDQIYGGTNGCNTGNHTGYNQFKGTKTSAEELSEIYEGLKQSYLTDFDILLSGYAPSADAVKAIGHIARDLKLNASTKPGAFFWGKSFNCFTCL